jgi:hypothetical protein
MPRKQAQNTQSFTQGFVTLKIYEVTVAAAERFQKSMIATLKAAAGYGKPSNPRAIAS